MARDGYDAQGPRGAVDPPLRLEAPLRVVVHARVPDLEGLREVAHDEVGEVVVPREELGGLVAVEDEEPVAAALQDEAVAELVGMVLDPEEAQVVVADQLPEPALLREGVEDRVEGGPGRPDVSVAELREVLDVPVEDEGVAALQVVPREHVLDEAAVGREVVARAAVAQVEVRKEDVARALLELLPGEDARKAE